MCARVHGIRLKKAQFYFINIVPSPYEIKAWEIYGRFHLPR